MIKLMHLKKGKENEEKKGHGAAYIRIQKGIFILMRFVRYGFTKYNLNELSGSR